MSEPEIRARRLLVIPESDELEPVLRHFERRGHASSALRRGRVSCFHFPSLQVVLALGGHGKAQLGIQTQYLIDRIDGLELVVCCGAAGGLRETSVVGDVVVGTETVEHDYTLRFVRAPAPRHSATPGLLEAIRNSVPASPGFRISFGPIASGDEDIVDPQRAREIYAATGALCVAWEGSGAARAAAFNSLGFVEIRCVTDSADGGAAQSFHDSCERVMQNGAAVVLSWLSL
jgi:adenosylhomocysteine nucleosidase